MDKKELNDLREELAYEEHRRWSKWMQHLFNCGRFEHGNFIIEEEHVKRWLRQAWNSYYELTEEEKKWDRDEADQTLLTMAEFKFLDLKEVCEFIDEK